MVLANNKSSHELQLRDLMRITKIFKGLEKLPVNFTWANDTIDKLKGRQPFLASMMEGFKMDLEPHELLEVLIIYTAIWEFFNSDRTSTVKPITQRQFELLVSYNAQLIATNNPADRATVSILFNVVIERIGSLPVFQQMEVQKLGMLVVGVKSIIECFQERVLEYS